MIASHNTYTYLAPRRWWHRLTAPLWRCQTVDIKRQISAGAALLDIRVRWDSTAAGWRLCHGIVDLGKIPMTYLGALVQWDTPCRIILERGGDEAESRFARAIEELVAFGLPISVAAIKRGWRVIYRNEALDARCVDHYYKPFDSARGLWANILNLMRRPSTIARFARAQASSRAEWLADPDHYHLIDHI